MLETVAVVYGVIQGSYFIPGATGAGAIIGALVGNGLAPIASTAVATTCDILQASSTIAGAGAGAGGAVQGICGVVGAGAATAVGGSAAKASSAAAAG